VYIKEIIYAYRRPDLEVNGIEAIETEVENVSYILDISEESLKLELNSSSMGSSGPGFVSIPPNINNICSTNRDRGPEKKGGGVVVYIKENIYAYRRPDLEVNGIEAIWVQIKINGNKGFGTRLCIFK
jgi:hypothetical protein